jgi:hypothetical protein
MHSPTALVSWMRARKAVHETVITRLQLEARLDVVWHHLMFYEEIPERPGLLLRTLLPHPVATRGDKTRVGATVRCVYRHGALAKRITSVDPPHLLQFEVVEQRLGIEDCVVALGGSYRLSACRGGTDLALLTEYRTYLGPRDLWRPLEALLVRQLHRHVLSGVHAAVPPCDPTRDALAEPLAP